MLKVTMKYNLQLKIYKIIDYFARKGNPYTTVTQLKSETGLSRLDISQAIYELHKKGKVKKTNENIRDGKWTIARLKTRKTNMVCKHLIEKDGRLKCKVKNSYISEKCICTAQQCPFYYYSIPCPGFEPYVSNEITIAFSRNMINDKNKRKTLPKSLKKIVKKV